MTTKQLEQQYDNLYGRRVSSADYSSRRLDLGDRQSYVIHARMGPSAPIESPDHLSYRYTGVGVDRDILAFLTVAIERGAVGFWMEVGR